MEDSNLPLVVPISAISDYFQCSICMCQITTSILTTCGHRYCDKCIQEWVNRRHTCPCCNTPLTATQLIKDHQFDSLISTIETEKEKAETTYFESLINSVTKSDTREDSLTPVEQVLKKHLKQGLTAHEKYFLSLTNSYKQKVKILEAKTQRAVEELQTHGLSQAELDQQKEDLHGTLSRQQHDLVKELESCAQLVADAYDKYLTSHVPNLEILPVKVTVHLSMKNIRLTDVTLDPTDTLKGVRDVVECRMIAKENPVVSWEPDVRFFMFGPFAKCTQCEIDQVVSDIINKGDVFPDVQLIAEDCRLGLQYGMKPGSEIVIHGNVKLESDLPKKCFVDTFQKGEGQKVDYFSCQDCGFKWVCRSCMSVCHQGHQIAPYIMQHQPAWACCYCPKKKKCVIKTSK